ncbi:putative Poly(R)-hydroxyalkanoic acid synthase, class III, PhaE subunit [Candidatus Defluviicoccus seviourii]|uniref:Poly(3-hydroxyalkanoate) polymerase subunit PhaE n=2 Tax=root TaxID=1 RepID=A0A564WE95_9PROT|nr:putative Poly(R)-hydroxyalkanoic acid synthase, class III, PhaE subunit [uncultured Defluviicoccus sp.]VUX46790.1 putative Poly(R)-hydroxyalkanoic acid synthase, class III, PhaE subunit [Candidatus Defluviicoccus seviourii]
MDWSEQTNNLMKAWTDAQTNLWSGWLGWAQNAAGMAPSRPMFDPSQWFKMGVDTWSSGGPTAQRLAGNIFGTPDVMSRSISLLMKAWQSVAPKIEQGQPWRPDLQSLLSTWQQEMAALPGRQAATASEFAELTKTLFGNWSPMTAPWLSMVSQAMTSGHPGAAFMSGTAGLNRMMGFEEGALPMLTGISEMPRATVVREKMGKVLGAVDAMNDLRGAQSGFHAAIAEAMGKAIERTIEHIAKLAEKGEKITSVRDLMRTWFSVADSTLNEVFTTEDFLAKQDKMIQALMTFKVKQREALELIYEQMEIPTRGALDEAYRDIQDLKREVRKLRKALKDATEGTAAAKAPARKAGGKKAEAQDSGAEQAGA